MAIESEPIFVGDFGDFEAAVIGNVFAQSHVAVHVDTVNAKVGILLANAIRGVVKGSNGLVIVQGLELTFGIVHNPHLVEGVCYLVRCKRKIRIGLLLIQFTH